MRILILGGTQFLGRAFAAEALAADCDVTTFNRGKSGTDLPGVEPIRGDRERVTDLRRLAGMGPWDAVVDTSGYVPAVVAASARELSGRAGAYLFVSSASATVGWPREVIDESSPIHECDPDSPEIEYGPAKAGCERAAERYFSGRVLIFRCGILLGPHENIGRLPFWLDRISRGGRVLAPGDRDIEMQLIDVRDVAGFGLRCVKLGYSGPFMVAGPEGSATYGSWLSHCAAVTESAAEIVWVDDEFLLAHHVEPWTELPLWVPRRTSDHDATWQIRVDHARQAGLSSRPIGATVRDTWAALRADGRPKAYPYPLGIDPVKEQAILGAWVGA
jgi:2'-hydroxyisoflavone reductase